MKPEWYLKPAFNMLLVGVGTSLFFTSSVGAVKVTRNLVGVDASLGNTSEIVQSDRPTLLAQRNYCRDGESQFISAETRGFWINICGGDLPHHYVGVSKANGKSIRIPLERYSSEEFIAINGDTRYRLTPQRLRVTQGRRTLVNQAVTRWN